MKKLLLFCAAAFAAITLSAQTAATFEDITVGSNGVFYDPAIQLGNNAWTNGSFQFSTYYDNSYGDYYSDIVVSSLVDSTATADYSNPVSYLYAPAQTPDGNNFAVWNQNYYGIAPIKLNEAHVVSGMYVNNTSAVLNYLTGAYTTFHANGYFMLTVKGLLNGVETGTVNCYLVDWRDAANKKTVTDWEWLDLTSLGNVDELNVNVDSDDSGDYGLNIPTYFCFDNLGGTASTAINSIFGETMHGEPQKLILNGQVLIHRGAHLYTPAGQIIR